MKSYNFKIEDREYAVSVLTVSPESAEVVVNGTKYDVCICPSDKGENTETGTRTEPTPSRACNVSDLITVSCPIPGILVNLNVSAGQMVRKGETIAVVEAMKMENDILSECDGTIESVKASKGDSLMEGSPIVVVRI